MSSLVAAEVSSVKAFRDVVIDSGNLTKDERMMWINSAKQACSNLSIVTVVCGITPTGENVRFITSQPNPQHSCAIAMNFRDRAL